MKKFLRNNSLCLVAFGLFFLAAAGQSLAGYHAFNEERKDHAARPIPYGEYLRTGHFVEALAENWESAFLELTLFVFLGKYLRQKGSAESRDPRDQRPLPHYLKQGLGKFLYAHSLGLTLLVLFIASFSLHAWSGAHKFSEAQSLHDQPPVRAIAYIANPSFWYESFQNWQSEFLSVGMMTLLTIFLRESGSPQSKPVKSSNRKSGE